MNVSLAWGLYWSIVLLSICKNGSALCGIARALTTNPQVLIADEPTGNLDSKRTEEIKSLLLDLNKKQGITIILVTHNPDFASIADKIIQIEDGKIKA